MTRIPVDIPPPPERPDLEGNYFYQLWRGIALGLRELARKRKQTVKEVLRELYERGDE